MPEAALSLKITRRSLRALDDEQLEKIHSASLDILEEVGVEVLDHTALGVLAAGGAGVDWSAKRARLPRGLVEEAVAKAPSQFRLRGRNPVRDLVIGGDDVVLIPTGGPAMVTDIDRGRRHGTYAEQVNFVKLGQHSRLLDTAYRCVEAQDLPSATRHLDFLYAAIRYTDKPIVAPVSDPACVVDSLALAATVFGGAASLKQTPGTMIIVNVDSPLRFSPIAADAIVSYARAGQPVQVTPFILPGIMSPVTPAGALAQQNAENLAGVTLAQLAAAGAPVVYGSFAAQSDMRTAVPVFGGGESILMEVAAGQLAAHYRLPHRGMGLVTTARTPDAQAAWEKMNCLWGLVMSQTHVVVHAAGWLEGGLTASYEQFVLDLEMLEGMSAYTAGLKVDDATLALETIREVGPGGSYMMADHTIANFRLSCYLSSLVDGRPYGGGETTLLERANSIWKQWLLEYEEPALDPGIHEAVRDYVRRRQRGEPAPATLG